MWDKGGVIKLIKDEQAVKYEEEEKRVSVRERGERKRNREGENEKAVVAANTYIFLSAENPNQVKKEKRAKVMCEMLIMEEPVHLCVTELIL